jgi:hypothetical protein
MSRTLQQHINDARNELDSSIFNSQRSRHLEDELENLEKYQINHPDTDYDPNPLELYCDLYPNALECRIYE